MDFNAFTQVTSHSMIREAAIAENPRLDNQNCHLVVDSGFSFTTIVPFFAGLPLKHAATRIDVGGKLLTNLLTENLSYKEINLKGEGTLVNQIKEQLSYVSADFNKEMELSLKDKGKWILKEFVLPDYKVIKRGYVRAEDEVLDDSVQVVKMHNDRFTVPEVLFNPSDIGINQAGVSEAV